MQLKKLLIALGTLGILISVGFILEDDDHDHTRALAIGSIYGGGIVLYFLDYWLHFFFQEENRTRLTQGYELSKTTFSIGGDNSWNQDEALALADEIKSGAFSTLQTRISNHYPLREPISSLDGVALGTADDFIFVMEKNSPVEEPNRLKAFLKVNFKHISGHQLNLFVNHQIVGNFLVSHHITCLKGRTDWWSVFALWIFSPATLVLLMINWFFYGKSSIQKYVHVITPSFFDSLDLRAFWITSHESIMESTEEILKEKGLLTEQIQTILNQSITNHNIANTQNVNVSGSGNSIRGFNQSNTSTT